MADTFVCATCEHEKPREGMVTPEIPYRIGDEIHLIRIEMCAQCRMAPNRKISFDEICERYLNALRVADESTGQA